jgi:hypothetical protein
MQGVVPVHRLQPLQHVVAAQSLLHLYDHQPLGFFLPKSSFDLPRYNEKLGILNHMGTD